MSSDLQQYQPNQTDSWVPVVGAVGDLAGKIAGTEFVGKGLRGKPAAVAAAILTGRELGVGPMTALRGLEVIDGTVSMKPALMAAKILAAGHRIEWVESTEKAAEVRIVRGDGLGEGNARFTLADAQRAGLANKSNWQKWPRAMLRARAMGEAAGMVCPDVVMGVEAADGAPERPVAAVTGGGVTTVQVTRPEAVAEPVDAVVEPVQVAEPAEEPEPQPEPADLITGAQMRKLRALLRDYQQTTRLRLDRDETRALIAGIAGRDLATANDLSRAEASRVIDRLTELLTEAASTDAVDAELIDP